MNWQVTNDTERAERIKAIRTFEEEIPKNVRRPHVVAQMRATIKQMRDAIHRYDTGEPC